jgi:DNA-binding transcriptional MerR regulator
MATALRSQPAAKAKAQSAAAAGADVSTEGSVSAAAAASAPPTSEPRIYSITELAAEFDVTPRAIRFYEDVGLLTPERAGRNRVYTHADRTRLKLTLRGKRLGLALSEIKQLVDMYDTSADNTAQLQAFLLVLANHRLQLEQQLDDIQVTLGEITQHEQRCRSLIAAGGAPLPVPKARRSSTRKVA